MYRCQPVVFRDQLKMDGNFTVVVTSRQTFLPKIVDLTNYEVGVSDIHCSEFSLIHGQSYSICVSSPTGASKNFKFRPAGKRLHGWHELDFIKAFEDMLSPYLQIDLDDCGVIEINPLISDHVVELPTGLSTALGLPSKHVRLDEGTNITGAGPVIPHLLTSRIMVTGNFVPVTLANQRCTPLVYCGPPVQHGIQVPYQATIDGSFYSLNVGFQTIFGDQIDLMDGQFSMGLHFRLRG
jgi:hypothetical protein